MAAIGSPWPAALAVSGGGDSLALMVLAAEWARARKLAAPAVLTVDHGLRPGSRKLAQEVKSLAQAMGLAGEILVWKGAKPASDIEAAARQARYRLMGAWCRKNNMPYLYLAHTEDDLAETFFLRLARGSGLDGLSAMSPVAPYPVAGFQTLSLVRPLLGFARKDLRRFLDARKISWHEDPMNADPRFARAKIRAVWPQLEKAGLTTERVAAGARHLRRAREALEYQTAQLLKSAAQRRDHRILLDREILLSAPREIGLRGLAELLKEVGGQAYRPRFAKLESLLDSLRSGRFAARTLHGCRLGAAPRRLAVFGARTLVLEKEVGRVKST